MPTTFFNSTTAGTNTIPAYSNSTTSISWNQWVDAATLYATDTTWTVWANTTSNQTFPSQVFPSRVLSAEELVASQRALAEAGERMRREAEEQREANERANQLLRDHLTAQQAADLLRSNYFELVVDSGRRYRVYRGRTGNIRLVEQGKETQKYCIHPNEFMPDADTMLAQKLLLETQESEFLRIANATMA